MYTDVCIGHSDSESNRIVSSSFLHSFFSILYRTIKHLNSKITLMTDTYVLLCCFGNSIKESDGGKRRKVKSNNSADLSNNLSANLQKIT